MTNSRSHSITILAALCCSILGSNVAAAACPALLDHSMKQLHSSNDIDLCDRFAGKPLLIVNTASHCGFTPQFSGLEQMYQRYKDQGVEVVGVASNSFNQAAASEEQAAKVCFVNFGVTFPMMAPVPVRGSDAHPMFAELAAQSAAPRWNFYKYVVDPKGKVLGRFGSNVQPDDPKITELLDKMLLNKQPG